MIARQLNSILFVIGLILFASCKPSALLIRERKIDAILSAYNSSSNPGASVLVYQNNKIITGDLAKINAPTKEIEDILKLGYLQKFLDTSNTLTLDILLKNIDNVNLNDCKLLGGYTNDFTLFSASISPK